MARWSPALALAAALTSCDAKDEDPAQTCDPFDALAQPIELRTILGIGRDANGTIYLADREDGEDDHVFVSAGGELVRKRITGQGGGGDATGMHDLFTLETLPVVSLQISVPTDAPLRMGIVVGEAEGFFEIGQEGEELEVLAADAIAEMPLRNLPGEVELEYAAETEDGQQLVVTRPADDWDYADFRLFFGPDDAVDEHVVHDVGRELDGGTTTIEFDLDGTTATAYFPSPYHDLPWTLTISGTTTDLTAQDAVPDGIAFSCLR
jgi:hypothetical protein